MNARQKLDQVDEILEFLNEKRIRCTYTAVAEAIGTVPMSVSSYLGRRRPKASWVVSMKNGTPTGYSENERHPDLLRTEKIIDSGLELMRALDEWRLRRG